MNKKCNKINWLLFKSPQCLITIFVVLSLLFGAKVGDNHLRVEWLLAEHQFSLEGIDRQDFVRMLVKTSRENGLDPLLVLAMMKVESQFQITAHSSRGALGLLQIKPIAAKQIQEMLPFKIRSNKDLLDPYKNLVVGVSYLAHLKSNFDSDLEKMIVAYNAGPTATKKMKKLPQRYLTKVLLAYNQFKRNG